MRILFFLLIPLASFSQKRTFKNLALEGCGTQAVAYAGVFKVLEQKAVLRDIEKVAGSSSGAVAGLIFSLGYSMQEIDSIMFSLPFQKFNDGGGGLYGKYRRAKKKFGIYKGDKFEKWLKALVRTKTGNADLSFAQLHQLRIKDPRFKDLYVTATNLSKQRLEVFSFERTPQFSVALAVRISGGIPVYFIPVMLDDSLHQIKNKNAPDLNYYVDGSMLCNYPISMFDSSLTSQSPLVSHKLIFNESTIGVKAERKAQIDSFRNNSIMIPGYHPTNMRGYLEAFANLMIETMERKYPGLENEKGRSIYVDHADADPRIRKMKLKTKKMLLANGIAGAEKFFETQR